MAGAISPTSPRRFKKGSSSPLREELSIARSRFHKMALGGTLPLGICTGKGALSWHPVCHVKKVA